MVTIKDIAREAGVSFTTVSNVIHGNTKRVSQATIEKINRIMKEMNYVPNMGARMLVQNQSHIIGVISNILTDVSKGNIHSPFIAEILGAIEKEIQEQGYYMMLYASDKTEEIESLITRWNVDGIITIGIDTPTCRKIGGLTDIPAVYTDCYFREDESFVNVGTEDEAGAYEAVTYLIRKGHRHIGYVSDSIYAGAGEEEGVGDYRLKGYIRALEDEGIPIDRDIIFTGDKQMKKKDALFEEICRKREKFTALAFCYDYYAIEMMDYLVHRGLKVPEDFSVIGFDDIDMARLTHPRLTTMRQGVAEKGRMAVQQLIRQINKEEPAERSVRLPVELIERESAVENKCSR